jgi:FkbM family methyltransferase
VKNGIKYILQKSLGFQRYLYVFALFKIRTLRSDSHERDFFHFLRLLRDGEGAVLDVGANIGIMTVHLAKHLPNSTVHAFEPVPENLSVLKRVINRFQLEKIQIHEIAVGDDVGMIEMVMPVQDGARLQGLSHVKHDTITEWNDGNEYKVELNTLDNVLNGERIQGIKIDVENFEFYALKGGKRILEKNQPVIYAELWDNENRRRCISLLENMGYQTFVINNNQLVPFNAAIHKGQNFIFQVN